MHKCVYIYIYIIHIHIYTYIYIYIYMFAPLTRNPPISNPQFVTINLDGGTISPLIR